VLTIGIDPGLTGALAILASAGELVALKPLCSCDETIMARVPAQPT